MGSEQSCSDWGESRMKGGGRFVLALSTALVLAACGTPEVLIGIHSSDDINPDDHGEALPVVLQVYQLRESDPFHRADFGELWRNGSETLADSLLTKREFVVDPASEDRVAVRRDSDATHLGVVAVFRDAEDAQWRSIEPLPGGVLANYLSVALHVDVDERTVVVER